MAKSKYVLYPRASKGIEKIVTWYEDQSFGLGHVFIIRFRAAIQRIIKCPDMFKMVTPSVRRYLIKQFPYVIFYTTTDDTIIILRVRGSKQKPLKRFR